MPSIREVECSQEPQHAKGGHFQPPDRRIPMLGLALWLIATLALPATAAAEAGCTGPGYMVALESDPIAVPAGKGRVLFGPPAVRVYEGKGWKRLFATRWNCIE